MKREKGERSDGGKQQEPEIALFPRLHVAETKKAGPRGPPRNKMALYEQLTVPSHKFKPSPMPLPPNGRTIQSPSMSTPIYLPQMPVGSYESMYSYMPFSYMKPAVVPVMTCMPVMNSGQCGVEAKSSKITSSNSDSTVMDGASESPSLGRAVGRKSESLGHCAPTNKESLGDDFAVPTYSSASQSSSQTVLTTVPPNRQGSRQQRAFVRGKERSSPCMNQVRRLLTEKSTEVVSSVRKDDGRVPTASGECAVVSVVDNDVGSEEVNPSELDGAPVACDGGFVQPSTHEIGQEELLLQQRDEAREKVVRPINASETFAAIVPPVSMHRANSLTGASERNDFSNQTSENQRGEGSKPSRLRRDSSMETGSSMLENVVMGSIEFRDVVDAFGQQEFWKVQMMIIRQQKLFALQVFELHRAIEVQQLLAKALCFSLHVDEVPQKVDNILRPSSPVAEVPETPEALEIPKATEIPEVPEVSERRFETKVCKDLNENSRSVPESVSQPLYPLPLPFQQGFNSGSAWPAGPYAANPCATRMMSPYMYVPYSGPCPPGYGAYPMMDAPMPRFGYPGVMQTVRFPTWSQPSMPQTWTSLNAAAAAAAWYGQHVSAAVPTANTGVASPARNSQRLISSGSGQSVENTQQAGVGSDVGVNLVNKVGPLDDRGWAKGWGSSERQRASGEGNPQNKTSFAGLRGDNGNCQNSEDHRYGETERDVSGCGVRQRTNEDDRGVECDVDSREYREPDSEKSWPAETSHAGPLQGRSLKHMRSESLEPSASRWFPTLSPAKRVMHKYGGVIKVVPRAVSATQESTASILLSIQTERRR